MELAEDVTEEVLDLVPGVDAVGAIQDDHDVHVRRAPCQKWTFRNVWLIEAGLQHVSLLHFVGFLCLYVCVCVSIVTLCCWSDSLSWF